MRLKDLTRMNCVVLPETSNPEYRFRYIDIGSVNESGEITLGLEIRFADAPSRARRIVRKGDVIVSTVRTYLRAIAPIDFEANDVIASTGFAVCTPANNVIPSYLSYALRCDDVIDEICKESSGISYPAINTTMLSGVSVPYYSLDIQRRIVAYLDEKTAAIDGKVAVLEKKLAAYKRLKKSVINQAVTRGLDPKAKLKDSGVDWIGLVPEVWEVKHFKRLVTIQNGCDYKHIEVDEGYPVIGSGGQFAFAHEKMYDGEVLFLGRKGTIDRPLYFKGAFWAVDTMFYAIPLRNACCKYLYYYSTRFPFEALATKTALPSMTQTKLNTQCLVIPPLVEQRAIADYLDAECAKINRAAEIVAKQIDAYKRLKRSLINEVVTGKRKVV